MALNKPGLAAALTVVFQDLSNKTAAQAASDVADAVDAYVRTATVTTAVAVASVSLVTVGVAASGPGVGTGTGALT